MFHQQVILNTDPTLWECKDYLFHFHSLLLLWRAMTWLPSDQHQRKYCRLVYYTLCYTIINGRSTVILSYQYVQVRRIEQFYLSRQISTHAFSAHVCYKWHAGTISSFIHCSTTAGHSRGPLNQRGLTLNQELETMYYNLPQSVKQLVACSCIFLGL